MRSLLPVVAVFVALSPALARASDRARIRDVRTWAYQLQRVDLEKLASTDRDLFVIDHAGESEVWQPADVERLRAGAGRRRLVLAYLSVGEAESYRAYWRKEWAKKPPRWLGRVNPHWRENYPVQFWDPEWQAILLGEGGYVDSILAQGFDGLYLDRLDCFEVWGPDGKGDKGRASGERAMVALVAAIAHRARVVANRPGFLLIGQNAPALARHADYLDAIDAIALEDVFTYYGRRRPRQVVKALFDAISPARSRALPILAVDYLPRRRDRARFEVEARKHGLVPFAAPSRWLDKLP